MGDFNYEILFSILMLGLLVLGTYKIKSLILVGLVLTGMIYFTFGLFDDWHMYV